MCIMAMIERSHRHGSQRSYAHHVRLQFTPAAGTGDAEWVSRTVLSTASLTTNTPPPSSQSNSSGVSLCSLILQYAGRTLNVYGSVDNEREMIVWDSETIKQAEYVVKRALNYSCNSRC